MKKRKGETSYKETAFGIIPRSKLVPLEIEGVKRAWDFILQSQTEGKISLTVPFLQEVHKIGFAWIFPDVCGKFRTFEVTVSKHKPPRFFQVPQMMEDFTEDLKTRIQHLPKFEEEKFLKELVSLLAWAHHRFLWIHPFFDYNGRIGRLLISMILMNLNLPPAELHVETKTGRTKYVDALAKADVGDFVPLEKIIHLALEEAAKQVH
ncbi:MAG: Fic family protein [Candidatus Gracilibacteria bacterium]|jgi:fido (protein-threonine AMPylation protein)